LINFGFGVFLQILGDFDEFDLIFDGMKNPLMFME
jgi:hypothetical protein